MNYSDDNNNLQNNNNSNNNLDNATASNYQNNSSPSNDDKAKNEKVDLQSKLDNTFNDVKDTSNEYSKEDMKNGKTLAILSYLGVLVLIPYLSEKKNQYVVFHAKQGIKLLILEVVGNFALSILGFILNWRISWLLSVVRTLFVVLTFILSIIGIKNVCDEKAKELPFINKIHL